MMLYDLDLKGLRVAPSGWASAWRSAYRVVAEQKGLGCRRCSVPDVGHHQ
jgi:hypothetical protein